MNDNLKLYAAALTCIWHDGTIRIEAGHVLAESQTEAEWMGLKFFREKYPDCSNHVCVVDLIPVANIPLSYYRQLS